MQQLRTSGAKSYATRGLLMKHYTISTWGTVEDMHAFARSGAHLNAMKNTKAIAREIQTYTFEADEAPPWKDARTLVHREGKLLQL